MRKYGGGSRSRLPVWFPGDVTDTQQFMRSVDDFLSRLTTDLDAYHSVGTFIPNSSGDLAGFRVDEKRETLQFSKGGEWVDVTAKQQTETVKVSGVQDGLIPLELIPGTGKLKLHFGQSLAVPDGKNLSVVNDGHTHTPGLSIPSYPVIANSPVRTDSIVLDAQTADIPATPLVIDGPGTYRLTIYASVDVADLSAPALIFGFNWNDGADRSIAAEGMLLDNTDNNRDYVKIIKVASGTPTYSLETGGSYGSAAWSAIITCEKI
jgi:hypothetical protein